MDTITRTDAERYVTTALGDWAGEYDLEAILADLREQLGGWDFTVLDDEDNEVDFWAVVRSHERPISTAAVPGCPSWCTRDKGHEFEDWDVLGNDVGVHEGTLGVIDSGAGHIALTLVQRVLRHQDGTVTHEAPFVTVIGPDGGADFDNPHVLRDLGDAVRAAAGKLEQIGQQ